MDASGIKIKKRTNPVCAAAVCIFLAAMMSPAPGRAEDNVPAADAGESISAEGLRELQLKHAELLLLDARNLKSYDTSHIEGAVLPWPAEFFTAQDMYATRLIGSPPDADAAMAREMQKYPKSAKIITYCNKGCGAGAVLMNKLKQLGFTDVRVMKDGIQAWEEKGYPVVKAPRP